MLQRHGCVHPAFRRGCLDQREELGAFLWVRHGGPPLARKPFSSQGGRRRRKSIRHATAARFQCGNFYRLQLRFERRRRTQCLSRRAGTRDLRRLVVPVHMSAHIVMLVAKERAVLLPFQVLVLMPARNKVSHVPTQGAADERVRSKMAVARDTRRSYAGCDAIRYHLGQFSGVFMYYHRRS